MKKLSLMEVLEGIEDTRRSRSVNFFTHSKTLSLYENSLD